MSKGIGKGDCRGDDGARASRRRHFRSRPGDWFRGTFVAVDLADAEATSAALARIAASTASAARQQRRHLGPGRVETLTPQDIDEHMGINFRAVLQCMQAVLPGMRAAKYGRIVNIGSRAGLGREGRIVYGGSKAAVVSLTRSGLPRLRSVLGA